MSKWDQRFLQQAQLVASWSKDPSTKVGAVIVDDRNRIIGMGYNGFPRNVKDLPERYEDRAVKYEMVIHAEVNAVLNAVSSVEGKHLYCTHMPCPRCAGVLIQAGIKKVSWAISDWELRNQNLRAISLKMFEEAGVEMLVFPNV